MKYLLVCGKSRRIQSQIQQLPNLILFVIFAYIFHNTDLKTTYMLMYYFVLEFDLPYIQALTLGDLCNYLKPHICSTEGISIRPLMICSSENLIYRYDHTL